MVKIRKAVAADVDWLLEQLKDFEREAAYKLPIVPKSLDYARTFLLHMISSHVVLIAESNIARLGFIAGLQAPHPFNPDIFVLSEQFWWVAPPFRNTTTAGARLLAAFENTGRKIANMTVITLEHNSPVKAESLTRRGFRYVEQAFVLEVA